MLTECVDLQILLVNIINLDQTVHMLMLIWSVLVTRCHKVIFSSRDSRINELKHRQGSRLTRSSQISEMDSFNLSMKLDTFIVADGHLSKIKKIIANCCMSYLQLSNAIQAQTA